MAPRIVAGYSPRSADRGPARFAAVVARDAGATVVLAAVHEGAPPPTGVEALADELRGERVEVRAEPIRHDSPAQALAELVALEHPALVVLGSTSRGHLGRVRPGGTAHHLLRESRCAVALVPRGHELAESGLRTVGAAFTPSPEGREALRAAAALARATRAGLRAVMVLSPRHAEEHASSMLARSHLDQDPDEDEAAKERLREQDELTSALQEDAGDLETETDVLYGSPAEGLIAASRTLDLLVMGPRAHGSLHALVLGSVTRRVMDHAACPVLILPPGPAPGLEAALGAVDLGAGTRDSRTRDVGPSASDPIHVDR